MKGRGNCGLGLGEGRGLDVIRQDLTPQRAGKDGTRVRYLQLAHKVRDPKTGKPRDQVLCHLGREDQIDREQLRRLIRSLSRFLDPADRAEVTAELQGLGKDLAIEQDLS